MVFIMAKNPTPVRNVLQKMRCAIDATRGVHYSTQCQSKQVTSKMYSTLPSWTVNVEQSTGWIATVHLNNSPNKIEAGYSVPWHTLQIFELSYITCTFSYSKIITAIVPSSNTYHSCKPPVKPKTYLDNSVSKCTFSPRN